LVSHDGTEIPTSRVMYESAPITITADQALAEMDGNGQARTDKAEASDFLQDILADGPLPAKQVNAEATEAGISAKSLRSAREALGIKPEKSGFEVVGYGHSRRCPKVPKMPVPRRGTFAHLGHLRRACDAPEFAAPHPRMPKSGGYTIPTRVRNTAN
jgi:hypothetical protein